MLNARTLRINFNTLYLSVNTSTLFIRFGLSTLATANDDLQATGRAQSHTGLYWIFQRQAPHHHQPSMRRFKAFERSRIWTRSAAARQNGGGWRRVQEQQIFEGPSEMSPVFQLSKKQYFHSERLEKLTVLPLLVFQGSFSTITKGGISLQICCLVGLGLARMKRLTEMTVKRLGKNITQLEEMSWSSGKMKCVSDLGRSFIHASVTLFTWRTSK